MRTTLLIAVIFSATTTVHGDDTATAFRGLAKLKADAIVEAQDAPSSGVVTPSAPEFSTAGAKRNYVVKLEADWCPTCKTEPISSWLEKAGWSVVAMNADANGDGEIDDQFGDIRLPHFEVILNGKEAAEYTGTDCDEFAKVIKEAKGVGGTTQAVSTLPAVVPAEAAATPYSEIAAAFEHIKLRPDQDVTDLGCGDGRVLMVAAEQFSAEHAIGVEIDPARAAASRDRVSQAGLSDRIDIITGDSTQMDLKGDVAFVYLYPDVLEKLRPKLGGFDKVISYMHPIPGLPMEKVGNFYYSQKQPASAYASTPLEAKSTPHPVTQLQTRMQWQQVYVAPWATNGRCGNRSCVMCYGGYQWKQIPIQVQTQTEPRAVVQSQPARAVVAAPAVRYCRSCCR